MSWIDHNKKSLEFKLCGWKKYMVSIRDSGDQSHFFSKVVKDVGVMILIQLLKSWFILY